MIQAAGKQKAISPAKRGAAPQPAPPPLPVFEDSLSLYELCAHFCCLVSGEFLADELVATQGVVTIANVSSSESTLYRLADKFSDKNIHLLYEGQLRNGDVVSVQGIPGKTANGDIAIKVSEIVVQIAA